MILGSKPKKKEKFYVLIAEHEVAGLKTCKRLLVWHTGDKVIFSMRNFANCSFLKIKKLEAFATVLR
jgi:hypothetical protein